MYKITLWYDISTPAELLKVAFGLFNTTSGSITEIINNTYCVDFKCNNTLEEIDQFETILQYEFPDSNLSIEVESKSVFSLRC